MTDEHGSGENEKAKTIQDLVGWGGVAMAWVYDNQAIRIGCPNPPYGCNLADTRKGGSVPGMD